MICAVVRINITFKDFPGATTAASFKILDKVFNNAVKTVLDGLSRRCIDVLFFHSRDTTLTSALPQKHLTHFVRKISAGPSRYLDHRESQTAEQEGPPVDTSCI